MCLNVLFLKQNNYIKQNSNFYCSYAYYMYVWLYIMYYTYDFHYDLYHAFELYCLI